MPPALWPTCHWKYTVLLCHLITFFCKQAKANWWSCQLYWVGPMFWLFLSADSFRTTRVQVAADWLALPTHSPTGTPAKRASCWGSSAGALSGRVVRPCLLLAGLAWPSQPALEPRDSNGSPGSKGSHRAHGQIPKVICSVSSLNRFQEGSRNLRFPQP